MALLAEEIVDEWLNRTGHFTIRGIKLGVDEVDLLAVRFDPKLGPVCRHIEVQASMRPISYISKIPKSEQKNGVAPNSAKTRTDDQLSEGIAEWIEKKFKHPKKLALFKRIFPSKWTSELVLNVVKDEREIELIKNHGITVHRLPDILRQINESSNVIKSAAGADFIDLLQLGSHLDEST